jgi:hypothetical protein
MAPVVGLVTTVEMVAASQPAMTTPAWMAMIYGTG